MSPLPLSIPRIPGVFVLAFAFWSAIHTSEASVIRYSVEHLQGTYGADLQFNGLSKGGVLTAVSAQNLVRIANGQRTDTPITVPGGYKPYDDRGISYYVPDGSPGVSMLDANGTNTNTGYDSQGYDITLNGSNRQGVIVGNQQGIVNGAVLNHGFIYDPSTGGRLVQQLGGVRVVHFDAVNDAGYLVGYGLGATVPRGHLYLWRDGEPAIPLVTTSSGSANAINAAAQVVGYADGGAFFWDSGNLYRPVHKLVEDPSHLGTFNEAVTYSGAEDISEDGIAVGYAGLRSVPGYTAPLHERAWLWTKDGELLWLDDLIDPSLGFELGAAFHIADNGQILVRGYVNGSNQIQDFLLTPTPEPSTMGLAVFGLAMYIRRRR